ncbi:deubiquitinase OTUD6B isoform X1 [Syngnathus scovelli]|uniref:deubiquitinase OTUD6B isoform X1 n=1 Tax=Syngnathus scovelli TaxID=161590 RepID=UPI002110CDC0|nr:deubiquitinase OTUD6B isoform X1 [Syngnathus scovelli]XP_049606827.1 deubiquitinase OTUD6B isoform X1 [Syngnathus scovelli]
MDEEDVETPEERLLKRQRREKKDLQAKIQSMKNGIPKNDKKRRKQMTEEIGTMEAELDQKHNEELRQVMSTSSTKVQDAYKSCKSFFIHCECSNQVQEAVNGVEALTVEVQPRITKAQKRRDKKAAQERERESRIAEAEVQNLKGERHMEGVKLAEKLAARGLQIKEISSDGHCMYRAIQDQLVRRHKLSVKDLRCQTAAHMRSHADDFLPFLSNPDTGDMYTAEDFEKYCHDVEHTVAWGGQLELQALSKVLQCPIEVIQADSSPITIGEEHTGDAITLIYMRHAYELGEHYNSVERLKEPADHS